jgi:hypothetical protein
MAGNPFNDFDSCLKGSFLEIDRSDPWKLRFTISHRIEGYTRLHALLLKW